MRYTYKFTNRNESHTPSITHTYQQHSLPLSPTHPSRLMFIIAEDVAWVGMRSSLHRECHHHHWNTFTVPSWVSSRIFMLLCGCIYAGERFYLWMTMTKGCVPRTPRVLMAGLDWIGPDLDLDLDTGNIGH